MRRLERWLQKLGWPPPPTWHGKPDGRNSNIPLPHLPLPDESHLHQQYRRTLGELLVLLVEREVLHQRKIPLEAFRRGSHMDLQILHPISHRLVQSFKQVRDLVEDGSMVTALR